MGKLLENGAKIALYALERKRLYSGQSPELSDVEKQQALKLSTQETINVLLSSLRDENPELSDEELIEMLIEAQVHHEVIHRILHDDAA